MGRRVIGLLLLAFALVGCSGELWDSLKEMNNLRADISKEFNISTVGIESSWINGRQVLNITLTNTEEFANSDNVDERVEEIALFVAQNYSQTDSVDGINIILENRVDMGPFNATSSSSYRFTPQTLLQETEQE